MPGFLRKKTSNANSSAAQAQPSKTALAASTSAYSNLNDAPPTPLYARFASTRPQQEQPAKPLVSGPMMLSNRRQIQQDADASSSNRPNDYNRQNSHGVNRLIPHQQAPGASRAESSSPGVCLISSPNQLQPQVSQSPSMGSSTSRLVQDSNPRRAPQTSFQVAEKPLPGAPAPPSKDDTKRLFANGTDRNKHPPPVQSQEFSDQASRRFSITSRASPQLLGSDNAVPELVQSSQQRRFSKMAATGTGSTFTRTPTTAFNRSSPAPPDRASNSTRVEGNPPGVISPQRPPSRSSIVSPSSSTVNLPAVLPGPSKRISIASYPNGPGQAEQEGPGSHYPSAVDSQQQPPPHQAPTQQSSHFRSRPSQPQASADDMSRGAQSRRNSHHPPPSFASPPPSSNPLPSAQPIPPQPSQGAPSGPRRMSVQAPIPQQQMAPVQRSASVAPKQRSGTNPPPTQANGSGLTRTPSKGPLIFAAMASVRSTPYPTETPPTPPSLEQYLNKWSGSDRQPPGPARKTTINGASSSRQPSALSPPRQPQAQPTHPLLLAGEQPRRRHQPGMYQQQPPQQHQQHRVNGMVAPAPPSSQYDLGGPSSSHHHPPAPITKRSFSPPNQSLGYANGDPDVGYPRDQSEGRRKMSKSSMRSLKKRQSDDFSSAISHAHTQSSASMSSNAYESTDSHPHPSAPNHSPERSHKLTKARPGHHANAKRPPTPNSSVVARPPITREKSFTTIVDEEVSRKAGLPLDDDPFAKPDIVTMVGASTSSLHSTVREDSFQEEPLLEGRYAELGQAGSSMLQDEVPRTPPRVFAHPPRFTPSPDEYRSHRAQRRGDMLEKTLPPAVIDVPATEDRSLDFPLESFISDPELLVHFLPYLSFYEWTVLWNLTKKSKMVMEQHEGLRESILARYLKTVGYETWAFEGTDPLALSLKDLVNYMRGVSMPTFQYSQISQSSILSRTMPSMDRSAREELTDSLISASGSTRAYTRVVLRLRCQAEAEVAAITKLQQQNGTAPPSAMRSYSRPASPTFSSVHGHGGGPSRPSSPHRPPSASRPQLTFRSPLFRYRRAPLLRVFVPNSEGNWLSDASVLECEAELRRAGVVDLLRPGDVVWDVAVGDEGNLGRMVWDGSYLIDLDYAYSTAGDLPKYLHTLSFPPSYFHRVLRTGTTTNPIIRVDIRPWGDQVATNLQLLQDRVRTETPQGASHNVVRWVHRSSFIIRPPPPRMQHSHGQRYPVPSRIAIPDAPPGTFVDQGWYGTIVVETEGTNEHLAELQERCGPGAFPPRVQHPGKPRMAGHNDSLKVWRILREKSRPGEIWIRTVSETERIN